MRENCKFRIRFKFKVQIFTDWELRRENEEWRILLMILIEKNHTEGTVCVFGVCLLRNMYYILCNTVYACKHETKEEWTWKLNDERWTMHSKRQWTKWKKIGEWIDSVLTWIELSLMWVRVKLRVESQAGSLNIFELDCRPFVTHSVLST